MESATEVREMPIELMRREGGGRAQREARGSERSSSSFSLQDDSVSRAL